MIFPNKRRIYYLEREEERDEWVNKIKEATGYRSIFDFYDLYESIGTGNYGIVKRAVHKSSEKEVAIKIIKKKLLLNEDMQMILKEI